MSGAASMFGGQEVVFMHRTYTVLACPVCGRQAEGVDLRCFCADVVDGLEPVEVLAVALDDPRIIVPPGAIGTPVRV